MSDPLPFCSGLVTPADLRGVILGRANPGVQASELRSGVREGLLEHLQNGGYAFIDSGALPAFIKGETVDFDPVLATYRHYARHASHPERLYVVAPDQVGCPVTTLELLGRYRDQLAELASIGVRILVPVQVGSVALADTWQAVLEVLAGVPAIPAMPMRAAATTVPAIIGFLQASGAKAVHLLGTSQAKHLDPVRAACPDVEISHDSNRIRAAIGENARITRHYLENLSEQTSAAWVASPAFGPGDITDFVADVISSPRLMLTRKEREDTVRFFVGLGLTASEVQRAIRTNSLSDLDEALTDLYAAHFIPGLWRKYLWKELGPRIRCDAVAHFFGVQRSAA